MELWLKTSLLLCLYGFFKELRPSEPYLTEYLLGPYHNLTESEVYYAVYPVWTYSYLCLLIAVFLLTDLLRYKPVIVFEGVGYVVTWCLLLWGGGVHWMQVMEFFYGISTSTEVAYYTYIYAQVDAEHYQKVTSYTRSALLAGKFISGVLSQVLYSTGLMDYHSLNYISLASVTVALCIAITLPPVKSSIYFHRRSSSFDTIRLKTDVQVQVKDKEEGKEFSSDEENKVQIYSEERGTIFGSLMKFRKVGKVVWHDLKEAYGMGSLVKWSIWWAMATCVNFQVGNYIQPLWESILPFESAEEDLYNGAVEAASTLFGALASFSVGYIHLNWNLVGESTLAVISLVDAVLLSWMGMTGNIAVGYVNYVLFRVSYQVLITVASFQVAKQLKADSYGLIFGFNMFLSLLLQSLLTLVVIEWLEVEPGKQFVIYGCYFGFLSSLFFIISAYGLGTLGMKGIRQEGLWEKGVAPDHRTEAPVGTTELY